MHYAPAGLYSKLVCFDGIDLSAYHMGFAKVQQSYTLQSCKSALKSLWTDMQAPCRQPACGVDSHQGDS